VLAEAAYYRLVFWYGMAIAPASALTTQHTLFGASWRCRRGLRLQLPPFDAWREVLTDRADYRATQLLGSRMREVGIEAFEYESARDPARGTNVALFSPAALAAARPAFAEPWLAETSAEGVRFYSPAERVMQYFAFGQFAVDGRLPMPAV
jgi:hypothetical protein